MSNIVAFHSGFLKKAQEIRLERSREEKIKSQIQTQNTQNRENQYSLTRTVLSGCIQTKRRTKHEFTQQHTLGRQLCVGAGDRDDSPGKQVRVQGCR